MARWQKRKRRKVSKPKEISGSDEFIIWHEAINRDTALYICDEMGLVDPLLMRLMLRKEVFGEYPSLHVVVHGVPGQQVYSAWRDLWMEAVSIACFLSGEDDAPVSQIITIRERIFHVSSQINTTEPSPARPLTSFWFRYWSPGHESFVINEGLEWFNDISNPRSPQNNNDIAEKLCALMINNPVNQEAQKLSHALDAYIEARPEDVDVNLSALADCLNVSPSAVQKRYKVFPFLRSYLHQMFKEKKALLDSASCDQNGEKKSQL